ncbi:ANTAR domain-containing protein [Streptomyces sp. NPDC057686]|uniref:GAF and ANTAR domain-containing protein n=1 Tax=Streptomyces sp. NPDC057686 TaxID=3346212 RepID=UPI00367394E8
MKGDAAGEGAAPEVLALAKVVARLRSEIVDLEDVAATTAVVERAKGVLMAQAGVSADTAYEMLLGRAGERGRTLLEECWIVLGRMHPRPPPGRTPADPSTVAAATMAGKEPAAPPSGASRHLVGGAALRPLMARLADGLATARGGDDVAELLRTVLGGAAGVDAVMIYSLASAGSLELTGRAGIDEELAEQWHHIPPLSGVAAHEAIAGGRALWLEDPAEDARRYLLIAEPPDRWPSRAWLPVPADGPPTAAIGFLRTEPGPFAADTRALLRRAATLCAGPLGPPGRPRDADAEGSRDGVEVASVQRTLDALAGPAILLTPLRSEAGQVEGLPHRRGGARVGGRGRAARQGTRGPPDPGDVPDHSGHLTVGRLPGDPRHGNQVRGRALHL